jgi:preprotein translocase subunit YajC
VTFTALIAQEPAAAAGKPPEVPFFMNPIFMIAMFGLFFLVVMLPAQRRQKREAAKLLESIKPGIKVATASGIIGTVVHVKDGSDEVTLRSEDSKIRVLRTAIVRVLGEDAEAKA